MKAEITTAAAAVRRKNSLNLMANSAAHSMNIRYENFKMLQYCRKHSIDKNSFLHLTGFIQFRDLYGWQAIFELMMFHMKHIEYFHLKLCYSD